jgi:hypothetical protein
MLLTNVTRSALWDAVGRPSCRSSLLGDPGANFLVETGDSNRTMKNSLNYVSTCLSVVDTRRFRPRVYRRSHQLFVFSTYESKKAYRVATVPG